MRSNRITLYDEEKEEEKTQENSRLIKQEVERTLQKGGSLDKCVYV